MVHWPKDVSKLRALLHIEPEVDNKRLCCHAKPLTRSKTNCRNPINKQNRSRITFLILSIVNERSLTPAASEYLNELAFLIMCRGQPTHQAQGEAKFETWEKELTLLSSPPRRNQKTKGRSEGAGKDETTPSRHAHTCHGKTRTSEPRRHPPRTTSRHHVPETPGPSLEPTSASHVYHTFKPYKDGKTVFQINLEISDKLRDRISAHKPPEGSVYVYELPRNHQVNDGSSSGFVKIGAAVDPVERMKRTKSKCGYTPSLLCAFRMPHHDRVESILQIQLHNVRKKESDGCPECVVAHKEWFKISERKARGHIERWSDWMHLNPYNHRGFLEERWQTKLDRINLLDVGCWDGFVNEDDDSPSEDSDDDSSSDDSSSDDSSSDDSSSDDSDDSDSDSSGFDTPDEDSDEDDTDETDYSSEEDKKKTGKRHRSPGKHGCRS